MTILAIFHSPNLRRLHSPYEIWAKLAQGLQRRSHLNMLTDRRTDRRKVITIAHPEHSSGELKKYINYKIFKTDKKASLYQIKMQQNLHTQISILPGYKYQYLFCPPLIFILKTGMIHVFQLSAEPKMIWHLINIPSEAFTHFGIMTW